MAVDIGSLIREMRKAAGMSQSRLASKIGISYQQVQKYEKGTSKLSVPRLQQIAQIFGVPVTTFIGDELSASAKGAAMASAISEEEALLLTSIRRMKGKLRRSVIEMVGDLARLSEGKPPKQRVA